MHEVAGLWAVVLHKVAGFWAIVVAQGCSVQCTVYSVLCTVCGVQCHGVAHGCFVGAQVCSMWLCSAVLHGAWTHTGCGHRRGRGRVLRGDPAGAVVRLFTMLWVLLDIVDIVDMFGSCCDTSYCRPIDGNIRFIYMKYI